ncbi:MAG: response regulator [Rudaea sp.]|nr:response regulator [Rudaea sp.]
MGDMSNAHILIVDDDTSFLAAAAEIAQLEGMHAEPAESLAEARAKMRHARFDMVLLDLELPDGNGLSLLHDVDPADNVPIAIITANPSVESAVRAMHLPVVDYIIKPLDRSTLGALFAKAAGSARRHSSALPPYTENRHASDEARTASAAAPISFRVGMTLEEVERQMLFETMAHFNNHKPKAAQALGISLKTVYNRLARFGYASRSAQVPPLHTAQAGG